MPRKKKKIPGGKVIDAVKDYRTLAAKLKKAPLSTLTFRNLETVRDVLKQFKHTDPKAFKDKACGTCTKWVS